MFLIAKLADSGYSLAIWIASGIYKIAAWAFEVFLLLATGQVVDSNSYTTIIQNFYVVLGVILLFFISFSMLKGMVNPDDSNKGTSTVKKIIINLITSAVIMALLPTIFGFLYDFQTSFIRDYNVIGKFFNYDVPGSKSGNYDENTKRELIEQGAFTIVNGVYTAFFNANIDEKNLYDECKKVESSEDLYNCQRKIKNKEGGILSRNKGDTSLYDTIDDVNKSGNFNTYNLFAGNVTDGEIEFQWLLSIVAGLLLIYVGVSFCFDMALRMVKLVFYQIIAPFPIFARVIPDGPLKDSFGKWVKVVLSCYFEVYIRIFVFYLAIYLCSNIINSDFIDNTYKLSPILALLSQAFLIMGIVMFMKQAPKLISDVTGIDSGNIKLGIKDKLKEGGFFAAAGATGAALTTAARLGVSGVKNTANKFKNIKGKQGIEKSKAIGSAVGSIFTGTGSVIKNSATGFYRGGKAGLKASNFSDVKNAAGKGAKETLDIRDNKLAYKASHGGSFITLPRNDENKIDFDKILTTDENGKKHLNIGGTLAGHISDVGDTVSRWAGVNNIQSLQESNALIEQLTGKVDKVVDTAKDTIRTQFLKKGKSYSFGVKGSDSKYGINYSADSYRKLSDLKDRAATEGKAQNLRGLVSDKAIVKRIAENVSDFDYSRYGITKADVDNETDAFKNVVERIITDNASYQNYTADEIQRIFGKYENDYAKEVANNAFKGNVSYDQYLYTTNEDGSKTRNVSYDEEAAGAAIRSAAEDARHDMDRYIAFGLFDKANEIASSLNPNAPQNSTVFLNEQTVKDGDLKVNGDTALDKLGAAGKILRNENLAEISKKQQKEQEKSGK